MDRPRVELHKGVGTAARMSRAAAVAVIRARADDAHNGPFSSEPFSAFERKVGAVSVEQGSGSDRGARALVAKEFLQPQYWHKCFGRRQEPPIIQILFAEIAPVDAAIGLPAKDGPLTKTAGDIASGTGR